MRKSLALALVLLLIALPAAAVPGATDSGAGPCLSAATRERPYLNFTYLVQDGSTAGSTAFQVDDGNLTIFIEAFPAASACSYKPAAVGKADIILQEPHGHNTHYDPDSVALVAKNTRAYVVGNSQLKSDMLARGVDSSKLVELSPTLGGNVTTTVLGVKITSFRMMHTSTTDQVDTWVIEMPSGIRFFHGTCASSASAQNYMAGHWEFYNLAVMILDLEHNFNAINSTFYPEKLIMDHRGPLFGMNNNAILYESYPGGQSAMIHNTTYKYVVPDYLPQLSGAAISPPNGDTATSFAFSVWYSYRLNLPPSMAWVVIDGVGKDMTAQASTGWRSGVNFRYSASLGPGTHSYHFYFEVDGKYARLPDFGETQGPFVNALPALSKPGFLPAAGDTDTNFTFFVNYQDANNDTPRLKSLFIDGVPRVMSAGANNYTLGANFTHTIRLGIGPHRYYFQFNDTRTDVRLPAAGDLEGPNVVRADYPPVLSGAELSSPNGTRSTQFTYAITYTDAGGDAPVVSKVVIDGTPHLMTAQGATYTAGALFTYTTSLPMGPHTHHFEFSDGTFSVRWPAESGSELLGPEVLNRAPKAVIKSPREGDSYITEDTIPFDGTGSTDPDGDELSYLWTSDLGGELGSESTVDTSLSEGVHNVTLKVDDGFNGTSSARIRITVIKLRPALSVSLFLQTKNLLEGQDVKVKATLSNSGQAPAFDLRLAILLDGAELKGEKLSRLDVGSEKSITCNFTAGAGRHMLAASVTGGPNDTLEITVPERARPKAEAGPSLEALAGEPVYFDGSKSTSVGILVSYTWDFGDGTNGSGKTADHAYKDKGVYKVTLVVTDDLGKEATDNLTVTVKEKPAPTPSKGLLPGFEVALLVATLALALIGSTRKRV